MACDAQTVLMLHMDGANNSTSFIDSSLSAHVMTANGAAKISTAQSKFGGAAGIFDGSTAYLSTPNSADFNFGTGDYTVDCWINPSSVATVDQCVWDLGGQTNGVRLIWNDVANQFQVSMAATAYTFATSGMSNGTWYHTALTRSGTNLRFFLNGVQQGSTLTSSDNVSTSNATFVGHAVLNAYYWNGYIDEFRVSKGIARWTANFTPPTSAYCASGGLFLPSQLAGIGAGGPFFQNPLN